MSSVGTDQRIGTELLGYRIEALIGRGGMGVVYRAEDLRLKRKVALKLLAPELAEDERFRERFLRESELAASLDHPHIVPIYDAGEHEGQLYIAMRYVEGSDLKQLLKSEGALEPKRALAYLEELADALDSAHARGLVHRDVKPSNALLDSAGHLYLSDFGLTKSASDRSALTLTGRIIGTVDYAAPEQIEGKPVDGRADVYSLGCLLYECLSGEVPFPRDSELAVLWAHVHEPPPKLSAYPALDPVLAKALAKDPTERHASCRELVEAAREALGLREVVVVRDRRPLLLVAAGLALALAAALSAFFLNQGGGGPTKPSAKPTPAPKVDSLQRIDPKTNKLVATIAVGPGPSAVALGNGSVWITSADDRTVSEIDPETNSVFRTSTVGANPTGVAVRGAVIWVASLGSQSPKTPTPPEALGVLLRLDSQTLSVQAAITGFGFGFEPSFAIGEGALWLSADKGVERRDPVDGSLVARIEDPFPISRVVAGEGAVWALDDAGLVRIDPAGNKIVSRNRRFAFLQGFGFVAGGMAAGAGAIWISDAQGDVVFQLDPASSRVTRTIRVGDDPLGITVHAGFVWVANHNDGTVSRIDAKRGKVVATIKVGPNPSEIAAGEGGVWVTVSPT